MSFCSNCGTKLNDTDVFCNVCGAPQKRSEGPTGPVYGGGQNMYAQNPGMEKFNAILKEMLAVAKGMVIAPISSVKEISKKNYKESSFIIAGLLMIIQALLFMWVVSRTIGSLLSPLLGLVPGAGRAADSFLGPIYGKAFLIYLLIFVVSTGLLFLLLYVFGRFVFNGKGTWLSTLNVVVASALPFTACVLIGLLLSFVYSTLGQVAAIFGILISLFSQYNGIKESMELSDNNTAFAVGLSNMVTALATLIIIGLVAGSLIPKLF